MKEFGRSYDLIGSGCKHREQQTQKRVCTLQDEVMLLEAGDTLAVWLAPPMILSSFSELSEFESEREEVKKLEKRLAEVEQTLQQKQAAKEGSKIKT